MSKVEIYGRPGCAKCEQAKLLCKRNDIPYVYKIAGTDLTMEQLEEMVPVAVRSVPQIFWVNGGMHEYIGGYDELEKKFKSMS